MGACSNKCNCSCDPRSEASLTGVVEGSSIMEAREQIRLVIDMSDLTADARAHLQEADYKLLNAETEMRMMHREMADHWHELLHDEPNRHLSCSDTRKFLLHHYTEAGVEGDIAESHHQIDILSNKRSVSMQMVGQMSEQIRRFDFDAISFSQVTKCDGGPLMQLGMHFMQDNGISTQLHAQGWVPDHANFDQKVLQFLARIGDLYRDVPYHQVAHAADIMGTVEWFFQLDYVHSSTTIFDHFMIMIAAAIHDVGHPGLNPMWHTKTMSDLAWQWNDKSVLENYHLSIAFEVLRHADSCNWFAMLPTDFRGAGAETGGPALNLQAYMRRGLIDMVLATDMAKHSKHVKEMQGLVNEQPHDGLNGSPRVSIAEKHQALDRKRRLLKIVLHAADISNPCKAEPLMLAWTRRVLDEFWAQGDEERKLNMDISPLCDREAGMASVPKGQLGFIKFVIQPFYTLISELIPQAQAPIDNLKKNIEFWEKKDAEQATHEEIFGSEDPVHTSSFLKQA